MFFFDLFRLGEEKNQTYCWTKSIFFIAEMNQLFCFIFFLSFYFLSFSRYTFPAK